MTDRIDLNMNLMDAIIAIADGNPGAISAMVGLVKDVERVDPDNALGPFGPLLLLDSFRIYGSSIWLLYKDICGQDLTRMLGLLRAVQLGIATRSELSKGIEAARMGAEHRLTGDRVDELLQKVRDQLPAFAKESAE